MSADFPLDGFAAAPPNADSLTRQTVTKVPQRKAAEEPSEAAAQDPGRDADTEDAKKGLTRGLPGEPSIARPPLGN